MTAFRLPAGRSVPDQYRTNFFHLYLDVAWFGILSGSAMSFVAIYAARQGASVFQVGLLSAGPAIMNLLFALPAGRWQGKQAMSRAVFWSSVLHRIFYLAWVPLPILLTPESQVWMLIGLTLLMGIPGVTLAIGFNALFADAVPPEWRGHVAGVRSSLLIVPSVSGRPVASFGPTNWVGDRAVLRDCLLGFHSIRSSGKAFRPPPLIGVGSDADDGVSWPDVDKPWFCAIRHLLVGWWRSVGAGWRRLEQLHTGESAGGRPAGASGWYNLSLNAAVLLGSLAGPLLGSGLGLSMALGLFAVCRLLAAIFIWLWG